LSPVQELLGIQFSWYAAKAALKRINSLLELEEEFRPISKVNPFNQPGEVDIEIKNVHFSYDGESQVLNDLSLHIPAGKKVALVGTSGGGKSTLI
ncbi:ATP-binding cassette domain-containing protein, partial [Vibrio cholerae]